MCTFVAVKLLSFILAFMVFLLSCIPCSDAVSCTLERQHQTAAHQEQPAAPDQDTHNDFCSPFCQCSCCAVAYALPLADVPAAAACMATGAKPVAAHLLQHPTGIPLPIWQPPQLV